MNRRESCVYSEQCTRACHLAWPITGHLCPGSISDTASVPGQSAFFLFFLIFFFSFCWRTRCRRRVASAVLSALLSVQSSRQQHAGGCCHLPSDREPSQTSNILFFPPFEPSARLMVSCQRGSYFASHFQGFARRSNSASADTPQRIRRWKPWYLFCRRHACLFGFCGFHRATLQIFFFFFFLWANTLPHISILEMILASSSWPLHFNGKRAHALVPSAEASLCQVIAVKSFTAAQGMFTAIFSWLNMNNICRRTAHQIRGAVNALHSDFVCAAGQEISKAWTSTSLCFQPVFHHLKGAKGSYLYLIRLNRPISPSCAAALSFALICSRLVRFAYGLLLTPHC